MKLTARRPDRHQLSAPGLETAMQRRRKFPAGAAKGNARDVGGACSTEAGGDRRLISTRLTGHAPGELQAPSGGSETASDHVLT